jgi:hypothetical protein
VRSAYSTLSTSFNQTCPDAFQLPFIVPNHNLRDLFKRHPIILLPLTQPTIVHMMSFREHTDYFGNLLVEIKAGIKRLMAEQNWPQYT